MKKPFFLLLMIIFSLAATVSKGQHHEVNKLDKRIELLLDTAAKHMVNFILTQKEPEYNIAMEKIAQAEALNDSLMILVKDEKGIAGKIENGIIEDRKEEIASYKEPSLKTSILNEKAADRKVKVRFRGDTYMVSPKSKKLYDLFLGYLPRN